MKSDFLQRFYFEAIVIGTFWHIWRIFCEKMHGLFLERKQKLYASNILIESEKLCGRHFQCLI